MAEVLNVGAMALEILLSIGLVVGLLAGACVFGLLALVVFGYLRMKRRRF